MRPLKAILLLVAFAAFAPAPPASALSIRHDVPAENYENVALPYDVVKIKWNQDNWALNTFTRNCTASAIAKNILITAAHCVFNRSGVVVRPDQFKAWASLSGDPDQVSHPVRIYVDPSYDKGAIMKGDRHDFALLIFGAQIVRANRVLFLTDGSINPQGSAVYVSGYGRKGDGLKGQDDSDEGRFGTLRVGTTYVQVLDDNLLWSIFAPPPGSPWIDGQNWWFEFHGQSDDIVACLFHCHFVTDLGTEVGINLGDSGGPWVLGNRLMGVTSEIDRWPLDSDSNGFYGSFAVASRIESALSWITPILTAEALPLSYCESHTNIAGISICIFMSIVDPDPSPVEPSFPDSDARLAAESGTDPGHARTSALGVDATPGIILGGTSTTGRVTLAAPAPSGGAVVNLWSRASGVTVPVSVTIAAGATSKTFPVGTTLVASPTAVTIRASYDGTEAAFDLTMTPPVPAKVTVTSSSLVGGGTVKGTVTLTGKAPAGGATITLGSSTAAAKVGLPITIPAGADSTSFSVTTVPVATSTPSEIAASYNGTTVKTTLTVTPAELSKVALTDASVVGGVSLTTNTVILTGAAPPSGAYVTLTSSQTSTATVPANLTVPAGAMSTTFTVTTRPVASSTSVTISVSYQGATKSSHLTMKAPAVAALSLSASTVHGGSPSTGTVTLTGVAPAAGFVVTLKGSKPLVAAVPVSADVTVPPGASSASFTVTTSPVASSASVDITASGGGASKSTRLTVNP